MICSIECQIDECDIGNVGWVHLYFYDQWLGIFPLNSSLNLSLERMIDY